MAVDRVEREPDRRTSQQAAHFASALILAGLSIDKTCEERGGRFDGKGCTLIDTMVLILGWTVESSEELYILMSGSHLLGF